MCGEKLTNSICSWAFCYAHLCDELCVKCTLEYSLKPMKGTKNVCDEDLRGEHFMRLRLLCLVDQGIEIWKMPLKLN